MSTLEPKISEARRYYGTLNGTAMLAATKFPTIVNLPTYSLRSDNPAGKSVGAGFLR
jgi:hypothetical protein